MPGHGGASPSLYEAAGGRAGCLRLATAFYARVAHDPVLRPLFPGKSFRCAIEEFSAFLAQLLGGPGADSQKRWWLSLRESHLRFQIGERERRAWIAQMAETLEQTPMAEPMRAELLAFFGQSSEYVVNQGHGASDVGEHFAGAQLSARWEAQRALDDAVASVRRGDGRRAIELAESPLLRDYGRSVCAGLLALMVRSGQPVLVDYAAAKLSADAELARERHAGRTLLHEAAAAGSLPIVQLLLSLGLDPNSRDDGGHTPLYRLANECALAGAAQCLQALVRAGADVNADDGVKHCTPLHMAARRGHLEVAEALLACGAKLEARDSLGDTPLRRAVNCNKADVAALLVAHGADVHSKGSRGLTPVGAARSSAMQGALRRGV